MNWKENTKTEMREQNLINSNNKKDIWTRIYYKNTLLINSVEWIEWRNIPTQFIICECGTTFCSDGGFVKIINLGKFIALVEPNIENMDSDEISRFASNEIFTKYGSIIFELSFWDYLCTLNNEIPKINYYNKATLRDIANIWILKSPMKTILNINKTKSYLIDNLNFCNYLSNEQAYIIIEDIFVFIERNYQSDIDLNKLIAFNSDYLETFYFYDTNETWDIFNIIDKKVYLNLNNELLFELCTAIA